MSKPKSLTTMMTAGLVIVSASTITELAVAESGFSVAPAIGIYSFDDDFSNLVDDETFGSLNLQYQFNQNAAIEASWGQTDSDSNNNDIEWQYSHIDALYYFNPGQKLRPYLAFGAGEGRFEVNGTTSDETLLNLGGGVNYLLGKAVAIRADLRGINSPDNETTSGLATVSLAYLFGGAGDSSTSTPDFEISQLDEKASQGIQQDDSDQDGVANVFDQCISTPLGINVDENGCAVDTDFDGIADYQDQCLNTAPEIAVDNEGCPQDLDNDGIADFQDNCADSQTGALVDQFGCAMQVSELAPDLSDVIFATGSVIPNNSQLNEIEALATFLQRYENTVATIEGHTDSTGDAQFNAQLSEKRAKSIQKILIEQFNVAPERLKAIGYGESRPIASNTTAEGRAKNRRVITVIESTQQ